MRKLHYFDDDWDLTRDILTAWWRHEKPVRPAIAVSAPRKEPLPHPPEPPPPANPKEQWRNAAEIVGRFEAYVARTYHGGCGFPYITAGLGPGNLNLYLGSEAVYMPDTIWYTPCFKDPAKANLKFLPGSDYWKWTVETTKFYLEAGRGKFVVGIPDIIEGLDILSEVLGTQELLTYLVDCPQEIHRLLDQLDDIYWQAFDPLYDLVKDERQGNAFIAFQVWGPGKTIKSQCDFAAMISPDMFAEFVCPHLERQCAKADFSVFHLDGPQCVRHLEHLLKVPSLDAVQWTPGYPNPAPADRMWWDRIWKPVYDSGKSALVLGNPPETIEPFLKEFGWKQTYLSTGCETERAARKLLDDSLRWGK